MNGAAPVHCDIGLGGLLAGFFLAHTATVLGIKNGRASLAWALHFVYVNPVLAPPGAENWRKIGRMIPARLRMTDCEC